MNLSVIIPTYNGAHKIGNILETLEEQSLQGFEVIVAVDGSTDHTIQFLSNWQAKNYHLRYCFQENRGRAAIRNFGAQQAKGKLLFFFDDDMRPGRTCLEQHLHHHKLHPGTLATATVIEEAEELHTDVQRYKLHLSRKWYQPLENIYHQSGKNFFFTAANCSLDAKDFWALGGFDERLQDAEDYDFGKRAMAAGKEIYFLKDAIAYHDDYITAKSYLKRLRQYKEAHNKLSEINPGPALQEKKDEAFKAFVYRVFGFRFWITLIDRESLRWLPEKARYKLYDIIFFSQSRVFPR